MANMHLSTDCLTPDSCAATLLKAAFSLAKKAVTFDSQGQFNEANKAYHGVIKLFETVLQAECIETHGHTKKEQLAQKLNEYLLRIKQLERYSTAISTTTSTLNYPDASHNISHNLDHINYSNNKNNISNCKDSNEKIIIDNNHDDSQSDEEDIEQTEYDIYTNKGLFSFCQGEHHEDKKYYDNAFKYYSDSAEWYLRAFKCLENDEKTKVKTREKFLKAMEKAENIKVLHNQNQSTGLLSVQQDNNPTSLRSRSSSFSSINDAQTTINNSNINNNNNNNNKNNNHEKRHCRSPSTVSSTISINEPNPTDDITTQRLSSAEIEVLKTTSCVNDRIYLPWIDESDLKEWFSSTNTFLDPDGSLHLSEKQLSKFGGWKRPSELMKHPQLIQLISSTSIIQDIVTDCSFVASLCVAAAYERKFKKQLITRCIYPQDKNGKPCYNPNGKYVIKLIYNVVDDLLPVSRDNTLMCTFSTNKSEIWPSIIEKAYMKIMGGYDFPGSNSGIDLYCLTGWTPEHIFIHEKSFTADKVWDRMLHGSKYGDVLITIATGEMTDEEAVEKGLVPTHAYAVIDIKVVNEVRFMLVKNPWSHKRWCGPYSHLDTINWTSELMEALDYDPSIAEKNDDGIFWIDYESVCDNFTSIHLNWNPELFTHRWVLHSVWPENVGPKKDIYNLGYNPQFSLTVNVPDKKPAAVHLLLSKHIMVTEEENLDYITLHVYNDNNGERVFYPGEPFKEGLYVNSPHILVRFNAPPGTSKYTIIVSQHEKSRSLYFSLRAYSLAPFKLYEIPFPYSMEQKITGQWTEQTAGGNASKATYMHNPQWKITIPSIDNNNYNYNNTNQHQKISTGLLLMLEASKTFAVHLLLVEGGKRATSVSVRDIIAESGPYRHGFCYFDLETIKGGDYTVIASTFEADLIGQFVLTAASNIPLTIEPIPAEGAGMFRKILNGEWISGYSAMGCPSYDNYGKNPRYLLEVRELTTIRVRLQADKIDPVPSINATIYERHPTELFGKEVATSGPYTNVIQGVTTGDTVLSQNDTGYIIVFATHEKDIVGEFSAIVFSDRPISIRNDR
ncbi:unnamed protein product [Cunninghamella blakesleeana]